MYYLIYPGYDHVFQYLMEELKDKKNCKVIYEIFNTKMAKKYWMFLSQHPTMNEKANEILSTFTSWSIDYYSHKISSKSVFIFSNIAIQYIPNWYLKKIKMLGGKLILYFLDDLTNRNSKIAFNKTQKVKFDGVYTFDKQNAVQNGFEHLFTMYSKLDVAITKCNYSATFIGSDKGRFPIIAGVFDKLADFQDVNKISEESLYFSVYNSDDENVYKYKNRIYFNQSLDYKKVIEVVNKSNCIIDIVFGEQTGLSLRAYEAIVYNKKLLTNNPAILDFPFYNSEYMQYFDNIDDIDEVFVFSKKKVDYGYNGEYSPNTFISKLSNQFSTIE